MPTTAKVLTPVRPATCGLCWAPFQKDQMGVEVVPGADQLIMVNLVCLECANVIATVLNERTMAVARGDVPCEATDQTPSSKTARRAKKPPP